MEKRMTDFIRLVSDMRAAQKAFFRSRSVAALRESKEIEKKVDAMLEQFKHGCYQQSLVMEQHGDNNVMLETYSGDMVIR